MKIRRDDKVIVVSWKRDDKWKEAAVIKTIPSKNRVVVQGVNIVKRSIKPSMWNPWQILEMEASIHVSNVMFVCPFTNKPTRLWYTIVEEWWNKKKFRFSKRRLKEKWGEPKDYIIK